MDRTNPNSYGPDPSRMLGPQLTRQPLSDTVQPIQEALDSLAPEEAYLIDSLGQGAKRTVNSQLIHDMAMSGETTDTMRAQVQAAKASDQALSMAEQSMNLGDDEFEKIFAQLQSEMGSTPAVPERGPMQAPGHLEQGLAALMSLANPRYAYDIASVPYQNQARIREENYQTAVQKYGQEMAKRGDRIQMLELRMKYAENKRQEAVEVARRAADDAYKRGEARRAEGLQMRGNLYDSKSVSELEDRVKLMRENHPEFLPSSEVISGLKKQFTDAEQAAQEKIKFQAEKEETDRVAGVLDDFRSWVGVNFPTGVSLGKSELKNISEEAKAWAEQHGVPLAKFPKFYERASVAEENLQVRKDEFKRNDERYDEEAELRNLTKQIKETELKQKQENLKKTLAGETASDPAKKAKRKQIGSLDTKIETARITVEQKLNQNTPTDPDERVKYFKSITDALSDEYVLVNRKRELVGGKTMNFQQYLAERYPAEFGKAVKAFIPGFKGEIGGLGKGTAQGTVPPKPPSGFGAPK